MGFFSTAAELIGRLIVSLASRSLSDKIKEIRTERRMRRLVDDAVDRLVAQIEQYLNNENLDERRKELLISVLHRRLDELVEDPTKFFVGDLNGVRIFHQSHPDGVFPIEIIEEGLGQFYSVLFPQIAHFIAGSRLALGQWEAEGFREEFKRLSQLAEDLKVINAKVAELPISVVSGLNDAAARASDVLLREIAQTFLNRLLMQLDLSPLRAERALHGSLREHFVTPEIRERKEGGDVVGDDMRIVETLSRPGSPRCLYGVAGVGKTTFSRWLQSRLLEANPTRLAVLLRLREFKEIEKLSLLQILKDLAGAHMREAITDDVLRRWYASGQLVVIFDGFDEVPEHRRNLVQTWIGELAEAAKQTAILVTSRPLQSGHLEDAAVWQEWVLSRFDKPRIVDFVERWHRYLPEGELSAAERKVDAEHLADTFLIDPSLEPLADTPLMLGTLLFVHHRDKQLPSGRVDLYERYISAMLGLRDTGLGIEARATKLADKEKRAVLAHVALRFHLEGIEQASDEMMRSSLANILSDLHLDEHVDRLLPALGERTGLIQGPGTWSFTHKTIGEFLIAELICEGTTRLADGRRMDRKELEAHLYEDSWTSVLFFWAGKTTPREFEELIRELLGRNAPRANALVLSLLLDQGDRLPFETRRAFALTILVASSFQLDFAGSISFILIPGLLPDFLGPPSVGGLIPNTATKSFSKMFNDGVLSRSDIAECKQDIRRLAMFGLLDSLFREGESPFAVLRQELGHVDTLELGLDLFRFGVARMGLAEIEGRLSVWLEAFPECRGWVPFLVAGWISDPVIQLVPSHFEAMRRTVGPILWSWRTEPFHERWLLGSLSCCTVFEDKPKDLLLELKKVLVEQKPSSFNLTDEQHSDLLTWCQRAIERRTELQALTRT